MTITKEISFSYNWNNKLNCNAFTTIRLFQPDKYIIGEKYKVSLKGIPVCESVIINIKNFKLYDLNDFIAFIDTGYNKEECRKIILRMYPKIDFTTQLLSLILILKSNYK
jgi:hypothetical protein